MTAYFVTGTDTDVGKTTLARALLAAAANCGLRSLGIKPAESGCARSSQGPLIPADAQALHSASSINVPIAQTCIYRFTEPVAPSVAAERAHSHIEADRIRRVFDSVQRHNPDLLLVEGAGGLLVPFADGLLAADIAHTLALPLIVVARPDLGTINHTALTLEVARHRGLSVAGFAFSCSRAGHDPDFIESNVAEIRKIQGIRFLGTLDFVATPTNASLAAAGAPLLQSLMT